MNRIAILGGLVALLAAGATQAQTTVFTTLNDADEANLFDCCNSLPILGRHTGSGKEAVAIPFTPAADARINQVDLALSATSGGNAVVVTIRGSTMGLPGRVKHHLYANDIPAGGQCCTLQTVTALGVPVKAGGHYWISVKANDPDFVGGWNLNSMSLAGDYAVENASGGWTMTNGQLPAVRVLAQ